MNVHISTDAARLDLDLVHAFLSQQAYWCRGIPRATVERAIAGSLCFGAYAGVDSGAPQLGFARVITDRATFAYLCDVFVLPAHRRRGVAKALMAAIAAHPDLQGLRRFLLFTADAHGLYARHGFTPLQHPARGMERLDPDAYTRPANAAEITP